MRNLFSISAPLRLCGVICLLASLASAAVRIDWTDPNTPPVSAILSIGPASGQYTNTLAITNHQVIDCATGTWFAVLRSVAHGMESEPSAEFSFKVSDREWTVEILGANNATDVAWAVVATVRVPKNSGTAFFKLRATPPVPAPPATRQMTNVTLRTITCAPGCSCARLAPRFSLAELRALDPH